MSDDRAGQEQYVVEAAYVRDELRYGIHLSAVDVGFEIHSEHNVHQGVASAVRVRSKWLDVIDFQEGLISGTLEGKNVIGELGETFLHINVCALLRVEFQWKVDPVLNKLLYWVTQVIEVEVRVHKPHR